MNILCDRAMPLAEELFSRLGRVTLKEARAITAENVREADMLIIRSTTRVNEALLSGSRVRFVGSGVIGTDHLDIPWLASRAIAWTNAPGCNAQSVADYFTAALLEAGHKLNRTWRGKTLGIVGVGNVGRRIQSVGEALGMRILCCDPPRQADRADMEAQAFHPLATLLAESDALSLHTPLTPEARHLIDERALACMKPDALLINMARGAVVCNASLTAALESGRLAGAAIDCWEGEPLYSPTLARIVFPATPHVAGHALEGKVNGTIMIYEAACRFLGLEPSPIPALPPPPVPEIIRDCTGETEEESLRRIISAVCGITTENDRFKAIASSDPDLLRQHFDSLRRNYPLRRQFNATRLTLIGATPSLRKTLAGLGFIIA